MLEFCTAAEVCAVSAAVENSTVMAIRMPPEPPDVEAADRALVVACTDHCARCAARVELLVR